MIAAFCILGIITSLIQFGLDVWGTTARGCRVIRKNATGAIISGKVRILYHVCWGSHKHADIKMNLFMKEIDI